MIGVLGFALALFVTMPASDPATPIPGPQTKPHCHGSVINVQIRENHQMVCVVVQFRDGHTQTVECRPKHPRTPRHIPSFPKVPEELEAGL